MAEPARKLRMTYAEYLALEQDTDTKHEFLDGEAWAMAGGTPRHAWVPGRLSGVLFEQLEGSPCQTFSSDLKVRVPATGLATYPDLAVVCGALEVDPEDRNAVTNPVVLVEVLSASTEAWDRGSKFAHYQLIASLRHYVLASAERARVELYTRQDDGSWIYRAYGAGETVPLAAINAAIDVDRAYRGLPEEPPEAPPAD